MDFHTALYHCREIEKHFEEASEQPKEVAQKKCLIVLDSEEHCCMDNAQILAALGELENAIEAKDAISMLGYEDLIDSLVDYFDRLIADAEDAGMAGKRGSRKLRTWRESTGKLAQLLCQSSD